MGLEDSMYTADTVGIPLEINAMCVCSVSFWAFWRLAFVQFSTANASAFEVITLSQRIITDPLRRR